MPHPLLRYRAILDLKLQRDKLHQYQRRIVLLTDKETEVARRMLAAGDKKRALLALRRKKYQEQLLVKTDGQLAQLEQLVRNVEFALIQKDVVFGLQQGTRVLKEIHAEMGGIEHVEKLMGESADAVAYQKVSRDEPYGSLTSLHVTLFEDGWGAGAEGGESSMEQKKLFFLLFALRLSSPGNCTRIAVY
jgi:charged multivesicular body protein 6